jgi:hypothetical protein
MSINNLDAFHALQFTRRLNGNALANGWYAHGTVFDPGTKMLTELQRLECIDTIFLTKEEAKAHALMLCKSWIDQYWKDVS